MKKGDLVSVREFEEHAKRVLPSVAYLYFDAGADEELTKEENIQAFQRIQLKPRILQDVSRINLSTSLLGQQVAMPIGIAPTAYSKFAWPDGEVSVAKAAKSRDTCYVVSSSSTSTFEEICEACHDSLKWFQLYLLPDRSINERFIRQAAAFGIKALVLTVDAPLPNSRRAVIRQPLVLPPHMKLAFTVTVDANHSKYKGMPAGAYDITLCWEDIKWLKSISDLPIVVKGIMTVQDALLAVKHGVSAVWVSNHGGRQLDTVPATIDVLPEIVAAVGKQVEVYMDGGIRSGTDVLKALALGARAVFVGTPIVWGLACRGEEGVEEVLDILKSELHTAMGLSGNTSVGNIDPSVIRQRKYHTSKL